MQLNDLPVVFRLGQRLFTAEKLPTLYRSWDEHEILELFHSDEETCLVAEDDGKIVAFALGCMMEKPRSAWRYGWLEWLGVSPRYKRCGIARRLLNQLTQLFIDREARIMLVDTDEDNLWDGFDYVIDVSRACEEFSIAFDTFMSTYRGRLPLISDFCPTVVRLIQVKYPDLTELVMPLDVPRELAAREFKEDLSRQMGCDPSDIGVIYLTPCPAKMVSIRQPAEKTRSALDGAVSIIDLYLPILAALKEISDQDIDPEIYRTFTFSAGWEMLGEMTRLLGPERVLAVSGMSDVIKVLNDIENSKLRDVALVEASSCMGGCIGGPLTVENMYVARSNIINLMAKHGSASGVKQQEIVEKYRQGYYDLEHRLEPRPLRPLDPDRAVAIEKKKRKEAILRSLPRIDCGCCGAPTCEALADDIVRGLAVIEDCIPMGGEANGKR